MDTSYTAEGLWPHHIRDQFSGREVYQEPVVREKIVDGDHILFIDREAREIMYLVASVRLSISALTAEPFDL